MVIKFNWIFDAALCDFRLNPIQYLEETTGAVVKVRINGSEFWVPASWYILVTDLETLQLDSVAITQCATSNHTAFAFSPEIMHLRTVDVSIIDYAEEDSVIHPMIGKASALVHPVGPASWSPPGKEIHISVAIGPYDLYKHLAGKLVGDLFS